MLVLACVVTSDLYLFYLIVLLKPIFNCSKNLSSSSVDKVTAGTYNFGSFISNITTSGTLFPSTEGLVLGLASWVLSTVNTQFLDQVKGKDISQLINSISNVFQKLVRCFSGTKIQLLLYFYYLLFFLQTCLILKRLKISYRIK